MTSSEDFKQAIRTGNIHEAFVVAMSNAPQLSVTTKIITSEEQHQQADNCLHTKIDLIEGKIENEIGEKLTGDRYSEIKQFHLRQVSQGHQTIQDNLISLQKMFQLMSAFQQQQTSEPQNWVDIAADVTRELPVQPEDRLNSKTASALEAGKTTNQPDLDSDDPEPRLPSFEEEEDGVVDDLMSLADIDDDSPQENPQEASRDWGEWLEDEPEVKSEVFDLKSLNIKKGQNWQKSWNASSKDKERE